MKKGRNRRLLQGVVIFVLLFFIVSTIGLSLVSITVAPGAEEIAAQEEAAREQARQEAEAANAPEVATGLNQPPISGVIVTGSLN